MLVANNANKKLLEDLKNKAVSKCEIQPGESTAGLIYMKTPVASDVMLTISCKALKSNTKIVAKANF
jgi:hypothetical protein